MHTASGNKAIVSGDGSLWDNKGRFSVGFYGSSNRLEISSGGKVKAEDSSIGLHVSAANNIAIVTGDEALWYTDDDLHVGYEGSSNKLQISAGGKVISLYSYIGAQAGSEDNEATVSGNKSEWETTNDLYIGMWGNNSSLDVTGGGLMSANGILIGYQDPAHDNKLQITAGGKASSTYSYIGFASGNNSATVSGPGSQWTTVEYMTVGHQGAQNKLNVSDGGAVSAYVLLIGADSPDNAVTVDGTSGDKASRIDAYAITVGDLGGTNTLTLSNGGQAYTNYGYIGYRGSANGNIATISGGAQWDVTSEDDKGALFVGREGSSNRLELGEGGLVNAKGRLVVGGHFSQNEGGAASNNYVSVTGSEVEGVKTRLTSAGLSVGVQGNGNTVDVYQGGYLETRGNAQIGNESTSGNGVSIGGSGSLWSVYSNLRIAGQEEKPKDVVILTDDAPQNMTFSAAVSENPNFLGIWNGGSAMVGGDLTVVGDGKIDLWDGAALQAGSLTLSDNSLLSIFLNDNANSSISVTGAARLDGDLQVKIDTNELRSNRYTVLTAGNVTGTFDDLGFKIQSEDFDGSFLKNAKLLYSGSSVSLQFMANVGGDDDLTRNQRNVSRSFNNYYNSGGEIPESFVPMLGMTGDPLSAMLNDLSGEVGSTGGARQMKAAAGGFTDVLIGNGSQPNGINIASADMGNVSIMPAADLAPSSGWTMWGSAFGGKSSLPGESGAGSHDTKTDLIGLATGWDYAVSSDATVGFAIAGGGTRWDIDKGLGNGESTFLQFGARGTQRFGASYLSLAGAYAWHWMETERTALSETLRADFAASSLAGRIEGGHRFGDDGSLGLTPYAALAAQASFLPDYTESGGSAALAYADRTATSLRSELGLKLDMTADTVRLDAGLAWARDWQDSDAAEASFRSLPGASFIVNGAEAPENLALVTAGAEFGLGSQTSLSARFDGEFGKDYTTYGGTLALSYSW